MVHKGGCSVGRKGEKPKGGCKVGKKKGGAVDTKFKKELMAIAAAAKKKAKTTYKKKAANPVAKKKPAKKKPAKKVVTPARTFRVRSMYGHNSSVGH
tara:strand:- start:1251 stop:1541 length:291 start_codon:yes stop_codon:yes gene_type:complete